MLYQFGAPHQWGNFTKLEKKTKTNKQTKYPLHVNNNLDKVSSFLNSMKLSLDLKTCILCSPKGVHKNMWLALIGQSQWLPHVVAFNWSHLILSRILGLGVGDERHIILDVRHPHTICMGGCTCFNISKSVVTRCLLASILKPICLVLHVFQF
jgi:hypothetical protein